MKSVLIAAATAALSIVTVDIASAQVGNDHFAAWDRHEGRATQQRSKRTRETRIVARHGKRVVRSVRVARRAQPVVVAAPVTLPTPFGVATRTVANMAGVPGEIAGFLNNVASQCGSVRVISTFRRGARVAGSGVTSCHAMGQAVDYTTSNPSCALRVASSVRLGHSIDYGRVAHFHVSNCAREMGIRFAHGGGRSRVARAGRGIRHARVRPMRFAARHSARRIR